MKKSLILVSAVVLMSSFTYFFATWTVDKTHAKLAFSITHLMVSEVEGSFKSFDAKITSAKDDFSDAVIELTADVNTINTDNDQRDAHIKGADFFDVAKYPTLTFKSKTFKKVQDKNYKVTGDLTIHGVTKTVTLDAKFNGTAVHPYNKKTIAGFKVTGQIKRSDFGIGAGTPSAVLSDEVNLNSNIEFVKE
jgi:polyisoprenoid-binding protein YceI